jgi:hypothetical protein
VAAGLAGVNSWPGPYRAPAEYCPVGITSWMTEPAWALATSAASATLAQVIARHGTADPRSAVARGEPTAPGDPAAPAGSAAVSRGPAVPADSAVSWDPAALRDTAAGDGSLPIAHPLRRNCSGIMGVRHTRHSRFADMVCQPVT